MIRVILGVLLVLLIVPVVQSSHPRSTDATPLMGIAALLLIAYGILAIKANGTPSRSTNSQPNPSLLPSWITSSRYRTTHPSQNPTRHLPNPSLLPSWITSSRYRTTHPSRHPRTQASTVGKWVPVSEPVKKPKQGPSCRNCGHFVSKSAKTCLQCGAKDPPHPRDPRLS